ncbi:MAG: hypothetical protein GXP27_01760 [Planctomycetes bacterium]|nr:hypothetical protein [Planctomycetota bacterium]
MVFLPGEVVVDYQVRLAEMFDPYRLWVNAYSNDVPCYIPSRRILREGGYEADSSMIYYDRPTRFAPEVEDLVLGAVRRLMPAAFRAHSPADKARSQKTSARSTVSPPPRPLACR